MWLFIDTSESGNVRIAELGGGRARTSRAAGRSGTLLPLIARRIGTAGCRRLTGIAVVAGPGSFSAVRGGVLVANLLARFLSIPLVGVMRDEAADLRSLARRLDAGEIDPASYVAPLYDTEPNITMARPA
ncbi:hypothetical protein HY479_01330 [Candidatus Uhrbacteria bacterium]|nr:hypothetical protein [Candidatus Uhrbacteria bacterium]